MPTPSALTNDQKNNLRTARYQSRTFLALNPNAIVATARINQITFPTSIAQITFDTGSGTGNVLVGQTVLISRTNDPRLAYFRGRVRKAISGSTLFINQTSANFADDDYIFILNDVALHPKLPYADANNAVFIDFDITYRALLPLINGLQSAYVITLNSTPQADLALAPTALATTQGATISTWSWSAPDATFAAGNSATQNVTLRWTTAGVRWVRLTVTDSGGRSNFMTFPVFVCSANYSDSFIKTGLEDVTITADETGYMCNVNAFDGVENVLDNTLAVVFSVETIGTLTTPIVSNVNFVGRLRNNTVRTIADANYVAIEDTSITIEGIGAQMARCPIETWSSINILTASQWGEIVVLTVWRMLAFIASDMSTLSNVASIGFDNVTNDYQAFIIPIQDETLVDALNSIADTINARTWYTGQGELQIRRSARFLSSASRNALTTVMDFEIQDLLTFALLLDPARTVGQAISYGGSFNVGSRQTDIYQAIAPAVTKAEGAGQGESINQILVAGGALSTAQAELGQRIADDFEQRNPIPKLDVLLHDGFHFIQPNTFQWYTFTIPTSINNRGVSYNTDTRWLLESVSCRYDNNAQTWDVNATFARETQGGAFQTVSNIAPGEFDFSLPPYLVDDAYPDYPDDNPFAPEENPSPENTPPITKEDTQPIKNPVPENPVAQASKGGDVVAVWNGDNVWLSTNYTQTSSPNWKLIFSGSGITDFKFGAGNHAYIISNDGTDSTFYRTSNVFADGVQWFATVLTGVYELIRTTDTAGEVYCLSNSATWSHTFDFSVDDGGWVLFLSPVSGTWDGSKWASSDLDYTAVSAPNRYRRGVNISRTFTSATITSITANFDFTKGSPIVAGASLQSLGSGGSNNNLISKSEAVLTNSDDVLIWTGTVTTDKINLRLLSSSWSSAVYTGTASVLSVTFTGVGANPFSASGQVTTVYSTDHGASFATPVTVGDAPPTIGGFDTQRVGDLVFVGADELTRQATNGGAYSDTTNGSTTGSYPALIRTYGQSGTNLIIGSGASVGGDTLWRVSGGTTAITPNDGSIDGLVVSPNCVDMWITNDTQIVGVFNFGGTLKLGRSTDGGNTWAFVTSNITADTDYIRVRQSDLQRKQVYSKQSQACLYSNDGGATVLTKTAPGASLLGIEVKS